MHRRAEMSLASDDDFLSGKGGDFHSGEGGIVSYAKPQVFPRDTMTSHASSICVAVFFFARTHGESSSGSRARLSLSTGNEKCIFFFRNRGRPLTGRRFPLATVGRAEVGFGIRKKFP